MSTTAHPWSTKKPQPTKKDTMTNTRVSAPSGEGALVLRDVVKTYAGADGPAVDSITLAVEPGQFVTLLGPSGCGKTTTLRMIAGFEALSAGEILVDGTSMADTPPNKRPMSMVFQSYALFPHLRVSENVGFGLTSRHAAKRTRDERIAAVLEMMGIAQHAGRYPHELSGGQQQRVALARALVMEPRILLFDEPLSNLDAKLRTRMREEIRSLQKRLGITSVFVTHDQSEAMTMSDVVVVMSEGQIQQVGTPREVYHRPRNEFVASFLGTANFIDAEVRAVEPAPQVGARATVSFDGGEAVVPCPEGTEVGMRMRLLLRSENLRVVRDEAVSADSVAGRVLSGVFDGAIMRYRVETSAGVLEGQAAGTAETIENGAEVRCVFSPEHAWLLQAE